MKIFGHTWEDHPHNPYFDARIDGVQVKVHDSDDPIWYGCELCHEPYLHWLCADSVWKRLPLPVQKLVICPNCFTALRNLHRLKVLP